jgi:hypothetical protein
MQQGTVELSGRIGNQLPKAKRQQERGKVCSNFFNLLLHVTSEIHGVGYVR